MKLEIYQNTAAFGADALEILLENEVQNNLPISFINRVDAPPDWLLATVKDENGGIALVAAMTPPFNITLYETRNTPNDAAVKFLSDELKSMGTALPGVNAESGLARRFAQARGGEFETHISMNVMRLDSVNDIPEVSGHCRLLREEDLFFAPYWAYHFGLDCGVEVYDIPVGVENARRRIESGGHFIWEDGFPVSQAKHDRSTVNGAVISQVYTPPHYRGRGYATAVVAHAAKTLLERGNKFCALFADAANPVSNGIYRKIGFRDVCVYEDVKFL